MRYSRGLSMAALVVALAACHPSRPAKQETPPVPTPADVHGPLTVSGSAGPAFVKVFGDARTHAASSIDVSSKDGTCGARRRDEDYGDAFFGMSAAGPGGPFNLHGRVGRESAGGWVTFDTLDVKPGGKARGSLFARADGKENPVVRGDFEATVCVNRYGAAAKTADIVVEVNGVETKLPYIDLRNPREIDLGEAVDADGRIKREGSLTVDIKLGDTPAGDFFGGSALAPGIDVRLRTGQYMPVSGQLQMGHLRLQEFAPVHGTVTVEKQLSSRAEPKTTIALRGSFDSELPEDENGAYAWLTTRIDPKKPTLVAVLGDRTEDVATRLDKRSGAIEIVRGRDACASTDVLMKWKPEARGLIPTSTTFETIAPMTELEGWTTRTDPTGVRGWLFVTSTAFDHHLRTETTTNFPKTSLPEDILLAGPFSAVTCH